MTASAIKRTNTPLLRNTLVAPHSSSVLLLLLLFLLFLHLPLIIVNATDDFGTPCRICGEGLQVGSPDTIFDFPGQPSMPCGELEVAGEEGLINPMSCGVLQEVIVDVCDCRELTDSPTVAPSLEGFCNVCGAPGLTIADPNAFILVSSSIIECRFVARQGELGLIDANTCSTLPQAMDDYCGGCIAVAPTPAPAGIIAPPHRRRNDDSTFDDSDTDGVSVFVFMFAFFLGGTLLCMCGMAFWFKRSTHHLQAESQMVEAMEREQRRQADASAATVVEDRAVRRRVLASIFPEQKVSSDASHDLLWYDPKVRQYRRWADQKKGTEKTCSICLEELEAQDRVVSGLLCSHVYHRKCILEWLNNKKRHDSCPNCRQPMWEPETYQAIKEDILQKNKAHDLRAPQTIIEDV